MHTKPAKKPAKKPATATTTAVESIYDGGAIYCRYPGQHTPQPCYLEIDPERGTVDAGYSREINGTPEPVWAGRRRQYAIPCLRPEAIEALIERLLSLAVAVCDGYEEDDDRRGTVDDDAAAAEREIEALCERAGDPSDLWHVWEACVWYSGVGGTDAQRRALGITADTTDAELGALASSEEDSAEASGEADAVEGIEEYLHRLRREAREAREDTTTYRIEFVGIECAETDAVYTGIDAAMAAAESACRDLRVPSFGIVSTTTGWRGDEPHSETERDEWDADWAIEAGIAV